MKQKENGKTIKTFAWASFLNDFGSDMIYPIWPLFVTTVLGAPMAALGFIDGLGDALVSVSQAGSGYLSDRIKKRKIFIWLGYLLGSFSRVGYAFSTAWQHLIPFRVLDRAGKMRGAPRDAIVADVSEKSNRGRNFGIIRTMDNLGAVSGIIFTILFFGALGFKKLFLIASIPSAIGVLLIMIFIKEKKANHIKIYKGLRLRDLNRNFKLFLLLSTIFSLGAFSYSFLLIFAKNAGFSVTFVPVLYLIFTLVASLSSMPFGILSDKIGRKGVLQLTFAFWGLLCAFFILSQAHWSIISGFILFGLHRGGLDTVQKAFVAELAPTDFRASVLGGFQMVVGLAALPASLVAGLLWDQISPTTPFYLSLGLTALAILLLSFVSEAKN